MPSKNVIKFYVSDGYYHVYNRGVEKRTIFQDPQDYKVFLSYLKLYLQPYAISKKRTVKIKNRTFSASARTLKNYHRQIELLTYCLMPNHFHLLIKQNNKTAMEFFMRSLSTKYSVYFNNKYNRVGPLFQGAYKAILIDNDVYLLHLSRYIHLNPSDQTSIKKAYSSYSDYLQLTNTKWLNTKTILSHFKTAQRGSLKDILSYQSFVEDYLHDPKEQLGELVID